MKQLFEIFNVKSDADLVLLVVLPIFLCVFWVVVVMLFPSLSNFGKSFFSFSKPKIKRFVVQTSISSEGKTIYFEWEVSSAARVEISPIFLRIGFKKTCKIFIYGFIAAIFGSFTFGFSRVEKKMKFSSKRLKYYLNISRKQAMNVGAYSTLLVDDEIEFKITAFNLWGQAVSSARVVNTENKNQVIRNELSQGNGDMLFLLFLNNYAGNKRSVSTEVLRMLHSPDFKKTYAQHVANDIFKSNNIGSLISPFISSSLMSQKQQVCGQLKFIDIKKDFITFRQNQITK
jgi:hypothetical protein